MGYSLVLGSGSNGSTLKDILDGNALRWNLFDYNTVGHEAVYGDQTCFIPKEKFGYDYISLYDYSPKNILNVTLSQDGGTYKKLNVDTIVTLSYINKFSLRTSISGNVTSGSARVYFL